MYHHGKDLAHGWWVSIQKRNNFDTNITFSGLFGPSKVFQGWKTFNSNLKKDSSIRNTFPTIQIMKNLKHRLLTRHPSFQMSVNRYNRQKGIQGFISLCCYMKEIDQRYKNEPMKRQIVRSFKRFLRVHNLMTVIFKLLRRIQNGLLKFDYMFT